MLNKKYLRATKCKSPLFETTPSFDKGLPNQKRTGQDQIKGSGRIISNVLINI